MQRFFLFAAFTAIMSTALFSTSCTESEKDEPFTIIGKWKVVDGNNEDTIMIYNLKEDGTCVITGSVDGDPIEFEEGKFKVTYTYTFDEESGTLLINNGEEVVYEFLVHEISKNSQSCKWMDMRDKKRPSYEVTKKKEKEEKEKEE